MAIDKATLRADIVAMIADWPSSMRYGGVTADVLAEPYRKSRSTDSDGILDQYDLAVTGSTAAFTAGLPDLNATTEVKISGEDDYTLYYVASKQADDIQFVLFLIKTVDRTGTGGII